MIDPTTLSIIRDLVAIAGVFIGLTYYIFNLKHQRETRQAQMFLQVYNNFTSKEFREANGVIDGWKWDTPEEFFDKYGDGERYPEEHAIYALVSQLYEGLGVLVRENLVSVRFVTLFIGASTLGFRDKWKPWVDYLRELGVTAAGRNIDYLADEIIKFKKKHPDLDY